MTAITELLQHHPEVALFAALSLGFFLGKRKVGAFSLGTSAGVLLADVLIGQLRIPVPALLKAVSFALFIFVVGYRVGPQFFRGLRGEGLQLAALALILAVTGLLTAYAAAVLLGYDKGTAAGLLAGALTQSAILVSAGDAIARLDRSPEAKRLLSDNIAVAYAVSYLFGTAGVAWFLSRIAPRLLGVDLVAACAALGRGSGEGEARETLASGPFLTRPFGSWARPGRGPQSARSRPPTPGACSSSASATAWTQIETVEGGRWGECQAEPVVSPALMGLDKGVWFCNQPGHPRAAGPRRAGGQGIGASVMPTIVTSLRTSHSTLRP
jgi:AspT/YidE/YbjL antiporter-like protein